MPIKLPFELKEYIYCYLPLSQVVDLSTYISRKKYNFDTMNFAVKTNRLDIVIWLNQNNFDCSTNYAMNYAANYGHIDIVIYLHEQGYV